MHKRGVDTSSSSNGGRLAPSVYWPTDQATAPPFPVSWIPLALTAVLALVSAWSWTVLRAGLNNELLRRTPSLLSDETLSVNSSSIPIEDSHEIDLEELSDSFTPEVLYWSADILEWASEYGLNPNLVAVVMQIESCGHPDALSSAGAMGLFQVMPFHFEDEENPFDPSTNAAKGMAYLSRAVQLADGQVDLALAGYNGGHQAITWNPTQWHDETRRYVSWGSNILGEINRGYREPPTLQAWLLAGGERLCRQAALAQQG
jgi:soluble lytic murein transglycosylase-like protein